MSIFSHCLAATVGASVAVLGMLTLADYEKAARERYKLTRVDSYYKPAALQISCTREGLEEWHRACRARKRSAEIFAK